MTTAAHGWGHDHRSVRPDLTSALIESFFNAMQTPTVDGLNTYLVCTTAMADYIVNFYNPLRRHSSLEYFTPDEFEALPSDPTSAGVA